MHIKSIASHSYYVASKVTYMMQNGHSYGYVILISGFSYIYLTRANCRSILGHFGSPGLSLMVTADHLGQ